MTSTVLTNSYCGRGGTTIYTGRLTHGTSVILMLEYHGGQGLTVCLFCVGIENVLSSLLDH